MLYQLVKKIPDDMTFINASQFKADDDAYDKRERPLFFSRKPIEEPLAGQGILIRNCANYHGLNRGWYRIAVKQRDENKLLISTLCQIMGD